MSDEQDDAAAMHDLDRHITEAASAVGAVSDGSFVTKWLVVAVTQDPDQQDATGYVQMYSGGHMPTHEVLGLLSLTREHVLATGHYVDDDED